WRACSNAGGWRRAERTTRARRRTTRGTSTAPRPRSRPRSTRTPPWSTPGCGRRAATRRRADPRRRCGSGRGRWNAIPATSAHVGSWRWRCSRRRSDRKRGRRSCRGWRATRPATPRRPRRRSERRWRRSPSSRPPGDTWGASRSRTAGTSKRPPPTAVRRSWSPTTRTTRTSPRRPGGWPRRRRRATPRGRRFRPTRPRRMTRRPTTPRRTTRRPTRRRRTTRQGEYDRERELAGRTEPGMTKYERRTDETGQRYIATDLSGFALTRLPLLNKSTGFTPEERRELGLEGLLPPHVSSLDEQVVRAYANFSHFATDFDKHVYLR